MTRINHVIVEGLSVVGLTPGSVVVHLRVAYKEGVAPDEAFKSIVHSLTKAHKDDDSWPIKRDMAHMWRMEKRIVEHLQLHVIIVLIIVPFTLLCGIMIFIMIRRRRKNNGKDTSNNIDLRPVGIINQAATVDAVY